MTLATTTDFEVITGQTLADGEQVRVARLLELAEGLVLAGAHGQNITSQTYTDATLYGHEGAFLFPQRPVSAVSAVEVDGVTYTSDDYRFTPGGDRRPALLIKRVSGADVPWGWHEATVTYTAGWTAVPAAIVTAVVATAKGIYQGSAATVTHETAAGSYVETYPSNSLALLAGKLPPATQKVLDRLCGVRHPASVEIQRG